MNLQVVFLKYISRLRTPADACRFGFKRNRDKQFLIDAANGSKHTMAQCEDRALRILSFLQKQGLKPCDVVAYSAPNALQYFEMRAAAHLGGFVFFGLPPALDTDVVIHFLQASQASAFFYRDTERWDLEEIRKKTEIRILANIDKMDYKNIFTTTSDAAIHIPAPDSVSTLNLSSGTTQKTPKIVQLTNRNWIASFYGFVEGASSPRSRNTVFLCSVSYLAAGSVTFLPALISGMTVVVLNDNFDIEQLTKAIEQYSVTDIYITPSRLLELLEWYRAQDKKPGSLTRIITGTETIPTPRLKESIEFFGPIISVGYGMVEVLPPLALLRPEHYWKNGQINENALGSVGHVAPGVHVNIRNDESEQCLYGKVGQVSIYSKTRSTGYLENEELNERYFHGHWFRSDDYGYFDKNKLLHILGRKQNIISKDDSLRFAVELEDPLHELPYIKRAAAIIRNGKLLVMASITPETNADDARKAILSFCRQRVDPSLLPDEVVIRDAMPLTSLGKLDRKAL